MAKIKMIEARVLAAIENLGLDCTHVIRGAEDHIKALAQAGLVDPAEEAVAYAKSVGCEVKEVLGGAIAAVAGESSARQDEAEQQAQALAAEAARERAEAAAAAKAQAALDAAAAVELATQAAAQAQADADAAAKAAEAADPLKTAAAALSGNA